MFRKTRRKIVIFIMCALVVLFAVTLTAIVLSEYFENRYQNLDMLDQYVQIYSLDRLPGSDNGLLPPASADGSAPAPDEGSAELPLQSPGDVILTPPDLGDDILGKPLFQLSTFYSVSFSETGEVLAVDTGQNKLYSEEELVKTAERLLKKGSDSGDEGTLSYKISERDGYTLVAFIDNTLSNERLNSLVRHTLLAGLGALAALFLLSVFMSRQIIRPLEENDRRQKQFVSDAGHELKTPVSVISTNAELLSRQLGPNEWLDNIRYENERMGDLVIQLLDLSQAEAAGMKTERLDFSRLVTGEVLPFESVAYEKGLTIRTQIDDNISIQGNGPQLSQLVSILLDNAIRHSEGGGEVGLTLKQQQRRAVLTVENRGQELSAEQQAHIFERFYRTDEARNSESGHYGLGLAIAKAITERHGGTIYVSCVGEKIYFTAELPIKTD